MLQSKLWYRLPIRFLVLDFYKYSNGHAESMKQIMMTIAYIIASMLADMIFSVIWSIFYKLFSDEKL